MGLKKIVLTTDLHNLSDAQLNALWDRLEKLKIATWGTPWDLFNKEARRRGLYKPTNYYNTSPV